jgi:hypothetical protein
MSEEQENAKQVVISQSDILKSGLKAMQKVLGQEVRVTREDMIALLNLEAVIGGIIQSMEALEGKSPEEIIDLWSKTRQQSAA